jgi:hypothetical protein
MTDDRRSHPRVSHAFDCRWFGKWGATDAELDDLSATGCHVVCRLTTPSIGDSVDIEVLRTTKEPLALSGEVIQVERGVGFSVRFVELEAEIRDQIESLIAEARLSNRRAGGS